MGRLEGGCPGEPRGWGGLGLGLGCGPSEMAIPGRGKRPGLRGMEGPGGARGARGRVAAGCRPMKLERRLMPW